jgi:site-specific recombinase XerD
MLARLAYWKEIGKIAVQTTDTRPTLPRLANKLRKPLSQAHRQADHNKTVNRYTAALSAVMKWASQEKMLRRDNPVRMIGRMKESRSDPQFIPTREDLDALRAAAEADADPMALPLILTTLATGMRLGELAGCAGARDLKEGCCISP